MTDRTRPWPGRRSTLPGPVWVLLWSAVHLLGVLAVWVVDFVRNSSDPSAGGYVAEVLFGLPFLFVIAVLPFAAVLGVLWALRHQRPWVFRITAVLLAAASTACALEPDMMLFYLPINVVVALLLTQPVSTADRDPVMG